jgi:uncharacterized lipoprotein YajG
MRFEGALLGPRHAFQRAARGGNLCFRWADRNITDMVNDMVNDTVNDMANDMVNDMVNDMKNEMW